MPQQQQEFIFDKIEAALNALDASTRGRIEAVDEKLRALGVTVEAFLGEPVDVWNDTSLHLGYVRLGDRYRLAVRRVRGGKDTVEPLRDADRATRIAVVDRLPQVLEAVEGEIRRRSARLSSPEAPSAGIKSAPAPPPAAARPAEPPRPVKMAEPPREVEVALPAVSEVDTPLRAPSPATPPANGGTNQVTVPAGESQESVDHMFRLFSRKGK